VIFILLHIFNIEMNYWLRKQGSLINPFWFLGKSSAY
jgi:uncharacterized membrane protein